MLVRLAIIVVAGVVAATAGYLLWSASHRSAVWGFVVAGLLGLFVFAAAFLIAYLMTRSTYPT